MHPNFSKPFIVQYDASKIAIGAVLSQKDDEQREHPVSFFNKKLAPAEENWTIHEFEAFYVVQGLKKWRLYLIGTPFTIETDHVSLKWMRRRQTLTLGTPA
jgi:phospholipid-translocating ATPase